MAHSLKCIFSANLECDIVSYAGQCLYKCIVMLGIFVYAMHNTARHKLCECCIEGISRYLIIMRMSASTVNVLLNKQKVTTTGSMLK